MACGFAFVPTLFGENDTSYFSIELIASAGAAANASSGGGEQGCQGETAQFSGSSRFLVGGVRSSQHRTGLE